jgi:hypothetical protein
MEVAEAANLRVQQSYTKEKKVGEGTYASVYLGKQISSGRKIAIKKVNSLNVALGLSRRGSRTDQGRTVQGRPGYVCHPRGQILARAEASQCHRGLSSVPRYCVH